ncbi:uncharacterized protein KY384_003989 [Bacidia gigantensis]|uniref:uncharacterized protein n=1 Tax=Bacidia gigantensis TaxID=2732470 RepID=UPI001D039DF2|nr:uncharacterized protein KY384_003989 [Bacidia gigantensis]KAG8531278.1 hypothetical protein KY384_003989 [Bacidia gigantensis]
MDKTDSKSWEVRLFGERLSERPSNRDHAIGERLQKDSIASNNTERGLYQATNSPGQHDDAFLRMTPRGHAAVSGFHDLVKLRNTEQLTSLQAQYIHVTGRNHVSKIEAIVDSETESTIGHRLHHRELYEGHFVLGWHLKSLSRPGRFVFGLGLAGSDDGGSDILLAPPCSPWSDFIQRQHFTMQMHPLTGAWTIKARAKMRVGTAVLEPGTSTCLSSPSTEIEINGMLFTLEFLVETREQKRTYIEARDKALIKQSSFPGSRGSAIPFKTDMYFHEALCSGTSIGCGSFGMVSEGYHPETGDPRVIKQISVKDSPSRLTVQDEIKALKELQGHIGITKLFSVETLRGNATLTEDIPYQVYLIQERGISFTNLPNTFGNFHAHRNACLMWDLLMGLHAIHSKGWMHRDITRANILYFNENPPRATLCDFGKVCFEVNSTDYRIAASIYLPPEVNGSRRYDKSIDIWMLGLALASQFYNMNATPKHANTYPGFIKRLQQDKTSFIPGLLAIMMAWNPANRPTASQLLRHPGFQPIAALKRGAMGGSKRSHSNTETPNGGASKRIKPIEEDGKVTDEEVLRLGGDTQAG